VTVFLPFLDTMLQQLHMRFTEKTKTAGLFSVLCPSVAVHLPSDEAESSFSTLWSAYAPALHANNIEPQDICGLKGQSEFRQWLNKWKRMPDDNIPLTLLSALQQCDRLVFPILYALLNISVVIPVSTATPERTFSALRLLKTYLRNRCSENRLNGLALMYFNSSSAVDVHDVIDRFASMKIRRLIL
jgi:hAT family C-terminal dimerisation region